jgi:septum site-determining protein MinC
MADPATTDQELVRISARGTLVNIRIDDSVHLKTVCRTLRECLARDRHLYSHGEVIVDIGQRILALDEQERIRKVIESESGLIIKQLWCDPGVLERERERIDNLMKLHSGTLDRNNGQTPEEDTGWDQPRYNQVGTPAGTRDGTPIQLHANGRPTGGERPSVPADIVRGTCRAGEVLRFPGNVVVVGNVNPGAQIIAQGDILIFGTLRGTVHAGAGGDSTAVILAMSSVGPQLRIADFLAEADAPRGVAGRSRDDSDGMPIIARVQNRAVHVSPYLKNHSIDHGGNPNER